MRPRAGGEVTRAVLGIETSTPHGGVALAAAPGELILHHACRSRTGYSRRLLRLIDSALEQAGIGKEDLEAIGVTAGPGSFTGVRLGLATAKTLAHSLAIPLHVFSTLECAARRVPVLASRAVVCVALDARRSEIYTGLYELTPDGEAMRLRDESVEPPEELIGHLADRPESEFHFSGDGAARYRAMISERLGSRARWIPSPWNRPAADSVALAAAAAQAAGTPGTDPLAAAPEYLRASDAERNLPGAA